MPPMPPQEDYPNERVVERLTESTLFKLLVPILLSLMMATGGWWANTLNARLDKIDNNLNDMKTGAATLDLRVRYLEGLEPQRVIDIKELQSKVITLDLEVQQLQGKHK